MGSSKRNFPHALITLMVIGCGETAGPELGTGNEFIAVSAGARHTCALTRQGAAYCWGSDAAAQLGTRQAANSLVPVKAETDAAFVTLSSGADHSCALDSSGQLYCWGNNSYGQLGNGTTVTLNIPVILVTNLRFAAVSSGWRHTCAITSAGDAYCWGAGGQGQLGSGRYVNENRPTLVVGGLKYAAISAGAFHTCGLTLTGLALCWGQNTTGQLGDGTLENRSVPTSVSGAPAYRSISAGVSHTCSVGSENTGYCWGSSDYGELGNSSTQPGIPGSLIPSVVFGQLAFRIIQAGNGFSCGVESGGRGLCWGRGLEGQLGNGQVRNWNTPQPVSQGEAGLPSFEAMSPGAATHACGLTVVGSVYCWGRGDLGQLGNTITSFTAHAMRVAVQ